MWGSSGFQPLELLITARTYPVPARKGVEVSCTGGISRDGRWIRLFPVPYRFLDNDKRFHKYQWVRVQARKASDSRPESFQPDLDSFQILTAPLSTEGFWEERKRVIAPFQSPSLCWLQDKRDRDKFPTLGFFKPKEITRLVIEPDSGQWSDADLARLRQFPLWGKAPAMELEKVPFKFSYEFLCDNQGCLGHRLMCTDWEMGQSYRRWSRAYPDWEVAFHQRYEREMIERFDTHFFVGTVHQHPNSWIIIGLFWPLKPLEGSGPTVEQLALF